MVAFGSVLSFAYACVDIYVVYVFGGVGLLRFAALVLFDFGVACYWCVLRVLV